MCGFPESGDEKVAAYFDAHPLSRGQRFAAWWAHEFGPWTLVFSALGALPGGMLLILATEGGPFVVTAGFLTWYAVCAAAVVGGGEFVRTVAVRVHEALHYGGFTRCSRCAGTEVSR
ncbi:hypothetical protein OG216_47950 (plasmid) [Streptomycetaceae bacterium NBC_01309]